MKAPISIMLAVLASACVDAPSASETPTLVGPNTYLLWSGRAGKAADNLGKLGQAIARARDFCETMHQKPEIQTESSDARERATFTCVTPTP